MGREKTHPLTRAKDRLRRRAEELGLRSWVRRNPAEAVVLSALLGFSTGLSRDVRGALRDALRLAGRLR